MLSVLPLNLWCDTKLCQQQLITYLLCPPIIQADSPFFALTSIVDLHVPKRNKKSKLKCHCTFLLFWKIVRAYSRAWKQGCNFLRASKKTQKEHMMRKNTKNEHNLKYNYFCKISGKGPVKYNSSS